MATKPVPRVPGDFSHVHAPRTSDQAFLFRLDPESGGRVVILVQSATEPKWEYAFQNAQHLLAAPPDTKAFAAEFKPGQLLRFRLEANPTKRLRKDSQNERGEPIGEKWIGKRVPVPVSKLEDWLARRAERNGFGLREVMSAQPGYIYVNKEAKAGTGHRLCVVRYEGLLEVVDPQTFREKAIIRGIGPAKGFGFGLLSVAPVR